MGAGGGEGYYNWASQLFSLAAASWTKTSAVSGSDWSSWYQTTVPNWGDGKTYRVYSRAKDQSGNYQQGLSSYTFTIDVTSPSVKLVLPVASSYNNLGMITGTGYDAVGIARVEVRVKQTLENMYWNNAIEGWQSENTLVSSAAWYSYPAMNQGGGWSSWRSTFTTSGGDRWQSGYPYRVEARAIDLTGLYDVITDTCVFVYDSSAPVMMISKPVRDSYYRRVKRDKRNE